MLALAAFGLSLMGCAGSRGLQARTQDAEALRAEAMANPGASEPWVQLALLERGRGHADAALAALHQALRRSPDDVPALTLLAKLFHECQRSADGLRYFASKPLAAWPEAVQLDVAILLADAGYVDAARETLENLRQGELAAAAAANLTWLDLLEGRPVAATDAGQDALEARNNQAVALLRAGRVDESEAILRQLVQQAPAFEPARTNLVLLLRHWRLDEEEATRLEAQPGFLAAASLSDAAVQAFLQGPREDASAPLPAGEPTHESN